MKEFVFLYPIQPYLDAIIGEKGKRWPHQDLLTARANAIIDQRYRQNGFGVNWVFFSIDTAPEKPDLSLKAEELEIEGEDRILTAGISFSIHVEKQIYPNPSHILQQLPKFQTLRVGGFHQWSCVDMLAGKAYETQKDVRVDEDTTEIYYLSGKSACHVPMVRDVKYLLGDPADPFHEYAQSARRERPWFAQIIP